MDSPPTPPYVHSRNIVCKLSETLLMSRRPRQALRVLHFLQDTRLRLVGDSNLAVRIYDQAATSSTTLSSCNMYRSGEPPQPCTTRHLHAGRALITVVDKCALRLHCCDVTTGAAVNRNIRPNSSALGHWQIMHYLSMRSAFD